MTNENEANRQFHVNEAGHNYEVHNMGEGTQQILFINKKPVSEGATEMMTVHDGTTNEAVLQMLIHRMEWLNERMPSFDNDDCINHLKFALTALERRTAERKNRGVEGTHQS